MVAAAVLAYFLVVVLGVLLVVFPSSRARIVSTLHGALSHGGSPFIRMGLWLVSGVLSTARGIAGCGKNIALLLSERPALAGTAIAVLIAPSLLVALFQGPAIFDFSDGSRSADRQISVLLEGEQLVPPLPLPPEIFTTREVEMVRPDVVHASRNWSLLDQVFMQRLLIVFKLMKDRYGYDLVLIEGYRSPERQAHLFEQGSNVTQAAPNMSYHQYGLAADVAFYLDGKVVISETDPWAMEGYRRYGEIAEQVGLTWGGNWKMKDYGHVELRRSGILARGAG